MAGIRRSRLSRSRVFTGLAFAEAPCSIPAPCPAWVYPKETGPGLVQKCPLAIQPEPTACEPSEMNWLGRTLLRGPERRTLGHAPRPPFPTGCHQGPVRGPL